MIPLGERHMMIRHSSAVAGGILIYICATICVEEGRVGTVLQSGSKGTIGALAKTHGSLLTGLSHSVQQIQAEVPLHNTPDDGYEIPPNRSIRIPFNYEDEPSTSTPYSNVNTSARGNRALVTIEQFYKEPTDGKRYMDTSMEDIGSAVASIRTQLCEQDEEIRQLRREIAHMQDQYELQIARLQGQTQGQTQMIARLQEQLNHIAASVGQAI